MEAAWNWKYVEMNRTFGQLFRIPQVMIINWWALLEWPCAVCIKTSRAFNTMKHKAEYQWQFTCALALAFWYTWNMNIKAPREWNVVFQLKDPVKRVLVQLTFSTPQNQSSLKCLEWSINFFLICERVAIAYNFLRSSVNAINLCTQLFIAEKQINGQDLALGK